MCQKQLFFNILKTISFLFLMSYYLVFAQENKHMVLADYLHKAELNLGQEPADSAKYFIKLINNIPAEAIKNQKDSLSILSVIGNGIALAKKSDNKELWEKLLIQGLQFQEGIFPDSLLLLANAYLELGELQYMLYRYRRALSNYYKARSYFSNSLEEEWGKKGLAHTEKNLGIAYFQLKELDSAEVFLQSYLEKNKAWYLDSPPKDLGLANKYLGNTNFLRGKYDLTSLYLAQALSLWTQHYGAKNKKLGNIWTDLGNLNSQLFDFDKALGCYLKAKDLYENGNTSGDESNLARNYAGLMANLAKIYLRLGKLDQATEAMLEVEKHLARNSGLDPRFISMTYSTWSNIERRKRNISKAKELLKTGIRKLKADFGSHPDLYILYRGLYEIMDLEGGATDQKIALLDTALMLLTRACPEGLSWTEKAMNCSFSNLTPAIFLLNILGEEFMGRDSEDLTRALDAFGASVHLVYRLRLGSSGSELVRPNSLNFNANFENAIWLAKLNYDKTGKPQYLNQAFQFMEMSKTSLLSQAVLQNKAIKVAKIPGKLRASLHHLKAQVFSSQNALADKELEGNLEAIQKLKKEYLSRVQAYDSLKEALREQYPTYFKIQDDAQITSLSMVQKNLKKGQAMLEYYWGNQGIFLLDIRKEGVSLHDLSYANGLKEEIQQFREQFIPNNSKLSAKEWEGLSNSLRANLIPDSISSIQELIVVPDGLLGYLPFETFVGAVSKTEKSDFRSLDYLIRHISFSYEYAASFWLSSKLTPSRPISKYSFVGFAPSYGEELVAQNKYINKHLERRGNLQLPGAVKEVKMAAALMGGDLYVDHLATENTFKSLDFSPRVLHLAMHAFTDDKNPLGSNFVFSAENDSLEDGLLHAYEIYGMSLEAELAVLSGCETGYGTIQYGEGIMSLSRAFAYAGVPSLVQSLWRAEDRATQEIMVEFYKNLKEQRTISQSLQEAKLSYLQKSDKQNSHPYYWANFIFVGNDKAINDQSNLWIWMIGLGLLAILSLYWLSKKRSVSSA